MVHGRIGDVEGEGCDGFVHEDAEVVAEVGAGDAECVHGGQDEGVAREEEGDCRVFDQRGEEGWGGGLGGESFIVAKERYVLAGWQVEMCLLCVYLRVEWDVQVVSKDTQRENGHGERIAAEAWVATEDFGEELVMVFCGLLECCSQSDGPT